MAITNIPDDLIIKAKNTFDYASDIIKVLKDCCPSKEQLHESIQFFKDNWSAILVIAGLILIIMLIYKVIISSLKCCCNKSETDIEVV
jgi:hypothetical protein